MLIFPFHSDSLRTICSDEVQRMRFTLGSAESRALTSALQTLLSNVQTRVSQS